MDTILTNSNSETRFASEGIWKGQKVWVTNLVAPCKIEGHALEIMHHLGDKGEHYCPTGYLMCPHCGGIADEPEPCECQQWGE